MTLRVTRQRLEIAGKKAVAQVIDPGYLPELVEVFLHNWGDGAAMSVQWSTDVAPAKTGAEDRRGLVDRPYRTLTVRWTGLDRGQTARVWQAALRLHQQRLLVPIYQDRTLLTEAVSPTATILPCDPSHRRFFVGGRAAIFTRGGPQGPLSVEFVQVGQVAAGQLLLQAPLELGHPAGAAIVPLMESELLLESVVVPIDGWATDATLSVQEVIGEGSIPPWTPIGDYPDSPTYRQDPILDLRIDWGAGVNATIRRSGERLQRGRGVVTTLASDRPQVGWEVTLHALEREAAWKILRWLDSRQGRLRPFWMVAPQALFVVLDIAAEHVDVEAHGNLVDVERFHHHLAIVYRSGQIVIRQIHDATEPMPGVHRLHVVEPMPGTLLDPGLVQRAAPAHLCRLAEDVYRETWQDLEEMEVRISLVELLRERTHRVEINDEPIAPVSPDAVPDLFLWLESPVGLFDSMDAAVTLTGTPIAKWQDGRSGVVRALTSTAPFQHLYDDGNEKSVRCAPIGPGGEKGQFLLEEPFWSNGKGFTIFLVTRRRETEGYDATDDYLVESDVLRWTATGVQLYEEAGYPDPELAFLTPEITYPRVDWHILCLTWKPGMYARAYSDGVLRGEASRVPVDLPATTESLWLRMAQGTGDTPSIDDTAAKIVLVFRRALEVAELNAVGRWIFTRANDTPGSVADLTWERVR